MRCGYRLNKERVTVAVSGAGIGKGVYFLIEHVEQVETVLEDKPLHESDVGGVIGVHIKCIGISNLI